MMFTARKEALALALHDAGVFTGRTFDLRPKENGGSLTPELVSEIGIVLYGLACFNDLYYSRVFGEPFAVAFSEASATRRKVPLIYFNVAEGSWKLELHSVHSKFNAGDKVLVLNGATATGVSTVLSIRAIKDAGLVVKDLMALVDMEQGDPANLYKEFPDLQIHALFRFSDLLRIFLRNSRIDQSEYDTAIDHITANKQ